MTILDDIRARLAAAPPLIKRYGPSPGGTRYQFATADKNNSCIVYGKELAEFMGHAANDIAYLLSVVDATERYAANLRALLDAERDGRLEHEP